ncbi:MAG TPA: PadR family transcriptional regulator [Candidatus Angelobacter sp.]|nr:PadR family transcriptional regulator [Candidatus Angelobacter sp.]
MSKAKKDQLSGTLDLLILKTLAQAGATHGYGIVLYIQRVTGDLLRVEEGSLYPALHRIEHAGWISSEWRTSKNNRRAKYYRLTAAGRIQLEREQESWDRVVQGVSSLLRFA